MQEAVLLEFFILPQVPMPDTRHSDMGVDTQHFILGREGIEVFKKLPSPT